MLEGYVSQYQRGATGKIEFYPVAAVAGVGEVMRVGVDVAKTVVGRVVAVEQEFVLASRTGNLVVLEGFRRVEVEDEERASTCEGQHLVAIVVAALYGGCLQQATVCDEVDHVAVETVQPVVFEVRVVGQRPLSSGVFARPAVFSPRKVDPLGVAKLVAHEVEIPPRR